MKKHLYSAISFIALHLVSPLYADVIGNFGANDSAAIAGTIGDDLAATLFTSAGMAQLRSAEINSSGLGIVAGYFYGPNNPFAVFTFPDQTFLNVSGSLPASGRVYGASINQSGLVLLGGEDSGGNFYAAHVTSAPSVVSLFPMLTSGIIYAASINDDGNGIIGGQYGGAPQNQYAAFVSSGGIIDEIDLSAMSSLANAGIINDVAINSSGYAVVGGQETVAMVNVARAGLVDPMKTVTNISLAPFDAMASQINSVAINDAGNVLIGGNAFPGGYAAFVDPDGTAHPIALAGGVTSISSVAINASGVGIVGGQILQAYAAFVYPDLTRADIDLGFTEIIVNSVSITDSGVALVGGSDSMSGMFAYLVAPDASTTAITGLNVSGSIDAVALINNPNPGPSPSPVLSITPAAAGPFSGAINSALSLSAALSSHVMTQHKSFGAGAPTPQTEDVAALIADAAFGERCDAGDGLAQNRQSYEASSAIIPQRKRSQEGEFALYLFPFYDKIHESSFEALPSYTNDIGGALAALEYTTYSNAVVGGGVSYAFNYAHYSNSLGHAKINEELGVVYTSFKSGSFFLNASVWGGLYQLTNIRHTPFFHFTSTLKTDGWLLNPHLELCYSWNNQEEWLYVEPFARGDWVNNWQNGGTEKGSSGLNLVLKSQYNSMLRSEAGIRFYQLLSYCWGTVLFTEKGSYINRTPFGDHSMNTFFVGGSASSFGIFTQSTQSQNLGGAQLNITFLPEDIDYPYGAIDAQGEFGSSFQSYFVGFEIGKRF